MPHSGPSALTVGTALLAPEADHPDGESTVAGMRIGSRRDDGCLQFDLMLPKEDDKHVFLVEKWCDQEALDAHAKGPMPGNTYKDWIVGRKMERGAPAD
ncbi:MAG TPA: antibiotic biosynthesis monooxygenase [Isosphaeraceae bacterium]|nr:antibiotic biosynthesis monooxygenase [Isosphaeraceae bacterium]